MLPIVIVTIVTTIMNNQLIVQTITFTYDESFPNSLDMSQYNEPSDCDTFNKFGNNKLVELHKTIDKLVNLDLRNNYIVNMINQLKKISNGKILVFSDRIDHLKILKNGIDKLIQIDEINQCKTYLYTAGNTTVDYRSEVFEQGNIIFTTYTMTMSLFIDNIHTIVLASPKMNVSHELEVILRNIKENYTVNPALVVDFVDDLPLLKSLANGRKQFFLRPKYTRCYKPIHTSFDDFFIALK